MNVHPNRLEKLTRRLSQALENHQLDQYRGLVESCAAELGADPLDFAAALLQITHPHLISASSLEEKAPSRPERPKNPLYRNVRYRLDVGSSHCVSPDEILNILVEESGVDKKRIARLEIREHYSLVDLPEGMPADIFQLLSEAELNGQRLNIKRIKPNRKNARGGRQQARNV